MRCSRPKELVCVLGVVVVLEDLVKRDDFMDEIIRFYIIKHDIKKWMEGITYKFGEN